MKRKGLPHQTKTKNRLRTKTKGLLRRINTKRGRTRTTGRRIWTVGHWTKTKGQHHQMKTKDHSRNKAKDDPAGQRRRAAPAGQGKRPAG